MSCITVGLGVRCAPKGGGTGLGGGLGWRTSGLIALGDLQETWSLQANIKRICTAKSQYLLFLTPIQKWTSGVVRLSTVVNNVYWCKSTKGRECLKPFYQTFSRVASQYSARPMSPWMCMLLLSDDLGSKNGLVWFSLCVGSGRLGRYSEVDGLEISRLVHLGPTECGRPCEPMEKCYGRKLGILNSCKIIGFLPLSYASKTQKNKDDD